MAKVMKKLSALLLAFAMMITMMPAIAANVYAEGEKAFDVSVNGVKVGSIEKEWLNNAENQQEAQIFPFATKKGSMSYVIAEGPSYEAVIKKVLGIESLSDIKHAKLNWNEDDVEMGLFDLYVTDLMEAVTCFKLVDNDGNDTTFENDNVNIAKIDGTNDLIPIVAVREKEKLKSYTAAESALENWRDSATTDILPYVGGNINKDTALKVDGVIDSAGAPFNFTGKFAMRNCDELNVKIPAPDVVEISFESPLAEPQDADLQYELPDAILAILRNNAIWVSTDTNVATVEDGKITPVAAGTCEITAKAKEDTDECLAKFNVTVNEAQPEKAFDVSVNGVKVGSIEKEWLNNAENQQEAQIFPFATKKGSMSYVIAEGPSYEAVIKKVLGIESLSDIKHAKLNWNEDDVEMGLFDLYVTDLMEAVTCFKLVDNDGNDTTFENDNVNIAKIDGTNDLIPIVAVREKEKLKSYTAAESALENWRDSATTDILPYVGGNINKDTALKVDGVIDSAGAPFNFTGKFAMRNCDELNIKISIETHNTTLSFVKTTPKQISQKYTAKEVELLGGVKWKSSDTKVAVVSNTGKVTPKGIGKCTVTATLADGTVAEKCSVTVKTAAFTPAVPGSFKAVNVKTRSAKLTWKKVTGATGYQVYRSRKKSSGFKRITTIKKNSTVRYTNKKLRKGRTYYYKIRAYRTVNGKTVYGKFTTVKAVKIKK